MSKFIKGVKFTMGGKEYEVLEEGSQDPASCLVYAPLNDQATDPLTIRMWKAEAKLAKGDIMISKGEEKALLKNAFYPCSYNHLEQIAELKKRIHAIERRRLTLQKAYDPESIVLLHDNVARPNKCFDIWAYSGISQQKICNIQHIRIRGLVLSVEGRHNELLLFNIADQFQSACRITGDTLAVEGRIKICLAQGMKTIKNVKSEMLESVNGGKIGLTLDLSMHCKYATGISIINASITEAAYMRSINEQALQIGSLAFPEIGNNSICVKGVCLDVYTENRN